MSLTLISVDQIHRELAKRQRKLPRLKRARAGIMRKLATVNRNITKLDAAIASLGGSVGRVGGRRREGGHARRQNKVYLAAALHAVMKGKTMSIEEAVTAVQKAGYKSKSPNFRSVVSVTLIAKKNRKLFKRVERGRYTTV